MKHKEGTRIVGEKVVLVPYVSDHVAKYHDWMEDPEIQRLTGSDRLALDQEYEMQKEWERDVNKCTFIILSREVLERTQDEVESMIGDTNLYLDVVYEESESNATAEIEIMIAEPSARRKGYATEALQLMLQFGQCSLGKTKFLAKIKDDNKPSIRLFESLGFTFLSQNAVFQEVTYRLEMPPMDI